MQANDILSTTENPAEQITLREAAVVWARIGLLSFGGPAGQIALMHRELVEERRWISDARFLHALNYCMLLPGPEAQQLATYIGWLMHRTVGGLIAGGLFILPGFVSILILSIIYGAYGDVPWVNAIFFGLKAAVLAIILEAVLRLSKRALRNGFMVAFAASAFVAIYFLQTPFPIIVVGAALIGLAVEIMKPSLLPPGVARGAQNDQHYIIDRLISKKQLPHIVPQTRKTIRITLSWLAVWLAPIVASAVLGGPNHIFTQLGIFFSKAAITTFGGAYSVLSYIAQQSVEAYGWLSASEMLDGLALAETTPGPLIMVVQFVGYLAAYRFENTLSPTTTAVIGSVITCWVTFAPCFLWIFAGAPYIEKLIGNRWLHASLSCITAAVVGVVLNLSVWFTLHVLFAQIDERDVGPFQILIPALESLSFPALVIAMGSTLALLRLHFGVAKTLAVAATAGFLWKMLV